MTKRRSPYPGVRPVLDRHGVRRFRFRRTRRGTAVIDTYLPGPWGGAAFVAAYERAIADAEADRTSKMPLRAKAGTIGHIIESYLSSKDYAGLAASTKRAKRLRLDRIRANLGKHPLDSLKVHHVEKIMDKQGGPHAANRLKKELAEMYRHAARFHGYTGPNPATFAKARKGRKGGFHTWTMEEVARFRATFPSGTQPRLAMELLLNSGAARVDVIRLGPRDVKDGSLTYRRRKTENQGEDVIDVTVPITAYLRTELEANPPKGLTFLCHGVTGQAYIGGSFGNAFGRWCAKAGVPGRAHGLRKAGATSLAEAGATEWEIASYLGHSSTKEAATYVAAANRALMAASGMAKRAKREQILSNLAERLDKIGDDL